MKEPDIPHDEQARLLTLKCLGILDTLPEERFDCLTRMAKLLHSSHTVTRSPDSTQS